MKADFTRDTFDPIKNFTRVLMQQGRVQIDADWNEQTAILLHYLRALATDVIGHAGGPVNNCGFGLLADPAFPEDFRITPGRYYVDGFLCELETSLLPVSQPAGRAPQELLLSAPVLDGVAFAKPVAERPAYVEVVSSAGAIVAQIVDFDLETRILTLSRDVSQVLKGQTPSLRRVVTYRSQPDYRAPDEDKLEANKTYMAYLDVWERHVTCLEDDSLREVALNGVDTATRARLVWQLKIAEGTSGTGQLSPCDDFRPSDSDFLASLSLLRRGRLKAKAKEDAQSSDPCVTPPHAQYRGVENQLYRVEIHRGGAAWDGEGEPPTGGVATFKWSRENGSVAYAVSNVVTASASKTTTVTLESLGRDDRFGLVEGDWVEFIDDDSDLHDTARPLAQVQAVDSASRRVTLSGLVDASFAQDASKHPLLRRWDQRQRQSDEGDGLRLADDGAALLLEDDERWLELEDGVKIQFQPSDDSNPYIYRRGDYWLIPARTATGDVEWPSVEGPGEEADREPLALPPKGVEHHYAPLGVVKVDDGLEFQSCRKQFSPLAKRPAYDYAFNSAGIGAGNLKFSPSVTRRTKKPPTR